MTEYIIKGYFKFLQKYLPHLLEDIIIILFALGIIIGGTVLTIQFHWVLTLVWVLFITSFAFYMGEE